MPRTDLTVSTPDGQCSATLHTPADAGSWPGVIFFVDAAGAREVMREMADQLAGIGYAVLLPDVYYRQAPWTPFDIKTLFTVPEERARLGELVQVLTADVIASDTGAYLEALAARPEVSGTTFGTTGYCMGGRMSLIAAGGQPERIAAAASFHGGQLANVDDPNSPHHRADRIRATVYVAGAENDASFPEEQAKLLDTSLTEAGVEHTIETYPAGHGFAVPDNPTYDPAAQERHWSALRTLYGAKLGG